MRTDDRLALFFCGAQVRVELAPLLPRIPPVGAVAVSILGDAFVDFSVVALRGDLMAIPGLEPALVRLVQRRAKTPLAWRPPLRNTSLKHLLETAPHTFAASARCSLARLAIY